MAEIIPFEPDPVSTGVVKFIKQMKKKTFFSVVSLLMAASNSVAFAADSEPDSLVINLKEVGIVASRATAKTPVAFTNIDAEQIAKTNYGQDFPFLLLQTPSVITASDAGNGVGYTSLRVRGTDASRINVTMNGVPVNDAESHSVFWVNMPDFASSVQNMQIQRGAGTSTNGAGAFGASINTSTLVAPSHPEVHLDGTYGMYNTHKETIRLSTGLIKGHWAADFRFSNIGSDGYIDRASTNLFSYFGQVGYYNGGTSLRLIAMGGKEKTYHAWDYASKEDMEKYGRTYNPCGKYTDDEGNTRFYDNQTDNYIQHNFQLVFDHRFNSMWKMNAALHYTKGDGYYEEYKKKRWFEEYALEAYKNADGEWVYTSDLVRRKQMDNGFGGGLLNMNYRKGRVDATFGVAVNNYSGWHFGNVIWVKNYQGPLDPNHEYYRNKAKKLDANLYAKATVDIYKGFGAYIDLQYRHIGYKINGVGDKFDWNAYEMVQYNVDEKFNFFNPKVGLNWQINRMHRAYASFAIAQKEPTRNNYTDGDFVNLPKAERLNDFELGYQFSHQIFAAGVNFYYMNYKNQLVLTGRVNEIGEMMSENVPDSYRMGAEIVLAAHPVKWFDWNFNVTFSKNRVKNFVEVLYENEESNPWEINCGDTPIAFSPNVTLANTFSFNHKGFDASLQSQYVSKQYMTNAKCEDQVLDPYFVSNLHLGYTFKFRNLKSLRVGLSVYNLFSEKYESFGYAGGGYYKDDAGKKVIYTYASYAAQAPIHVLGNISISF